MSHTRKDSPLAKDRRAYQDSAAAQHFLSIQPLPRCFAPPMIFLDDEFETEFGHQAAYDWRVPDWFDRWRAQNARLICGNS